MPRSTAFSRLAFALGLALALLFAFAPRVARAHATATSSIVLDIQPDGVDAEVRLPLDQLNLALGAKPDAPPLSLSVAGEQARLRAYVSEHLHVTSGGGGELSPDVHELSVRHIDDVDYLVAPVAFRGAGDVSAGDLSIRCDLIVHRVVTHHVLLSVRRDFARAQIANDAKAIGVFTYSQLNIAIARGDASLWRGFGAVFGLGRRHIAEGTDHLLFLLVLLLPGPVAALAGRWRAHRTIRQTIASYGVLVTAFTIGHSVSLALATLNLVVAPSRPVEMLIAASILVTAVHALRPLFPRYEPLVALGFGLVHGLAFATVLQELGLHGAPLAASLIAFNLGIEAMQLLVVLLVAPWLLLLSRTTWYSKFRIVGASLAAIAALGWLIERGTARENAVARAVNAVAAHPAVLVAFVAILAIVASIASRGARVNPAPGSAHGRLVGARPPPRSP